MGSSASTVADLLAAVDVPADGIVSQTIYADDDVRVVLFSFAAGQQLSDHTAPVPVTLQIIVGEAEITMGEEPVAGRAGTWIHLPADTPHSVVAKAPLTMLLIRRN